MQSIAGMLSAAQTPPIGWNSWDTGFAFRGPAESPRQSCSAPAWPCGRWPAVYRTHARSEWTWTLL